MPPIRRERKNVSSTAPANTSSRQQRNIQAFGRISKAQVGGASSSGKRKAHDLDYDGETDAQSKKAKTEPGENLLPDREVASLLEEFQSKAIQRSPPLENLKHTPAKKALPENLEETPTKGATSILQSFSLQGSSPSTRSSSPIRSWLSSPPTSPLSIRSSSPSRAHCEELPGPLHDLITLHSSLLSALSLHYAHHSTATPVDLRVLNVSIERIWKKRKVGNDDIQRILGLTKVSGTSSKTCSGACSLSLVDYGQGRICVEFSEGTNSQGIHRRPLEEERLQACFEAALIQHWSHHSAKNSASRSASDFIDSLPLLPVVTCNSLSKLIPLLAKGQRRLEDLKSGAVRGQKSSCSSSSSPSAKGAPTARPKLASSRSDNLLSRIRAKELVQSILPPPPSAEVLAKKSALRRIEEIAPVLGLLVCGSSSSEIENEAPKRKQQMQIKSFTMPSIVQHLQMSLRNPISKDDTLNSVKLLSEMCPSWVSLKDLGRSLTVTVRSGQALRRDELTRKVEEMLQSL